MGEDARAGGAGAGTASGASAPSTGLSHLGVMVLDPPRGSRRAHRLLRGGGSTSPRWERLSCTHRGERGPRATSARGRAVGRATSAILETRKWARDGMLRKGDARAWRTMTRARRTSARGRARPTLEMRQNRARRRVATPTGAHRRAQSAGNHLAVPRRRSSERADARWMENITFESRAF